MLIRARIIIAQNYCYIAFFPFHTPSSAFRAKNKNKLAYIVMEFCESEIFSQVMNLTKWSIVPSNGVGLVTGWKGVALLMNWCNGEVRDWKSDENLSVKYVNFHVRSFSMKISNIVRKIN